MKHSQQTDSMTPHEALRRHVTDKVEAGEAEPIVAIEAPPTVFRCHSCRNTVSAGHVPDSDECHEDRLERELSQREW